MKVRFISMVRGVCCLAVALFLTTLAAEGEDTSRGVALRDVINAMKMRSEMMATHKAKVSSRLYLISHRQDWSEPGKRRPFGVDQYEVTRKGEKVRILRRRFKGNAFDKEDIEKVERRAWDGEKHRTYPEIVPPIPMEKYTIGGSIDLAKSSCYVGDYFLTPMEQYCFSDDVPIVTAIQTPGWKLVGTDQVGEYPAVLLEGPRPNGTGTLKLWVCPSRDFAPVKLLYTPAIKGFVPLEMADVRLKQVDGIWVIDRAVILIKDRNESNPDGWQAYEHTYEEIEVGREIPDEYFVLKFPPGLRVFEEATKIQYLVGPDGQLQPELYIGDDVDSRHELGTKSPAELMELSVDQTTDIPVVENEAVERQAVPAPTVTADPTDEDEEEVSVGVWWAIGVLVALVAAAAWYTHRRQVDGQPPGGPAKG